VPDRIRRGYDVCGSGRGGGGGGVYMVPRCCGGPRQTPVTFAVEVRSFGRSFSAEEAGGVVVVVVGLASGGAEEADVVVWLASGGVEEAGVVVWLARGGSGAGETTFVGGDFGRRPLETRTWLAELPGGVGGGSICSVLTPPSGVTLLRP